MYILSHVQTYVCRMRNIYCKSRVSDENVFFSRIIDLVRYTLLVFYTFSQDIFELLLIN